MHRGGRRQAAVTQRTVAERAGVSMMTVSNVINGTGKFSEATRRRVQAAVIATGYVPNIEARRLAGAAGTRIALLYSDARTPFLTEVLLAMLEAASRRGSQLLVRDSPDASPAEAEALLARAVAAGAEALVLVPPFAELLAASPALARLGMPAVAFSAAAPLSHMHSVRIDNRGAARALTAHLLELGHREIGFIAGPRDHADSHERLAGFRTMMRQAGLPVRASRVQTGEFTFQSGCEAADILLASKKPPSAIIASNDDMAVGVQWAAQRRGLQLPWQLSVAGFDDTPAARRTWPPLTVIGQPMAQMASRAMDLLVEALTAPVPPPMREVVCAHALVVRGSTCIPGTRRP